MNVFATLSRLFARPKRKPAQPSPPRVYDVPIYAVYSRPVFRPVLRGLSPVSLEAAAAEAERLSAEGWGPLHMIATQEFGAIIPAGTTLPREVDAPEQHEKHERTQLEWCQGEAP